jgi:hypothetical protein
MNFGGSYDETGRFDFIFYHFLTFEVIHNVRCKEVAHMTAE